MWGLLCGRLLRLLPALQRVRAFLKDNAFSLSFLNGSQRLITGFNDDARLAFWLLLSLFLVDKVQRLCSRIYFLRAVADSLNVVIDGLLLTGGK